MNSLTGVNMSLRSVDFAELYERHLCRHSQFGLNVLHLIAVLGTYASLCGIAHWCWPTPWFAGALAAAYAAALAPYTPLRLWMVNTLFVTLVCAVTLSMPQPPIWFWIAALPAWHRFQIWSHRLYPLSFDMSAFDRKYRRGLALFLLLALFELPLLVNYLAFDRRPSRTPTVGAA